MESCLIKLLPVLIAFFTVCKAGFDLQDVPRPRPEFCSRMPTKGSCRARNFRYRFNAETNECERFLWGGCYDKNQRNMFRTANECENTCKRPRAPDPTSISCKFEGNLARECSLENFEDFTSIRDCIGLPSSDLSRSGCLNRGCCWHDTFGICYQKQNAIAPATCLISYATKTGFWGKIILQAAEYYPSHWIGAINFNVTVGGGFCVVRDDNHGFGVRISPTTFQNRKKFLLSGQKYFMPGERITIMFSGSFKESNFNTQECESINLPVEKPVTPRQYIYHNRY